MTHVVVRLDDHTVQIGGGAGFPLFGATIILRWGSVLGRHVQIVDSGRGSVNPADYEEIILNGDDRCWRMGVVRFGAVRGDDHRPWNG